MNAIVLAADREILVADGEDPNQRPAARFTLDGASEPNLLPHDISRIFFGRDMQCAQCHDHPIVADYLQSDFQVLRSPNSSDRIRNASSCLICMAG
ncbi:MAG: hypothetical protein WKF77_25530 [Planctomycetaceae bacterium]